MCKTTVGITMVKDEVDIIETTIRHMMGQCDYVVVMDNNSTDGTLDIIESLDVCVLYDPEVAYYQSTKMTKLAKFAANNFGAKWIVPFDADEIWTARIPLKELLPEHDYDYGIITAELFDHVATGIDPDEPNPIQRIKYRRQENVPLVKVACRYHDEMVIEQGNHWVRYPIPARFTETPPIRVHHYPYRSVEQFIRKVRNGYAAYKATENLHSSVGAHWREWGTWSDEQLADLFRKWYWRPDIGPITIEGESQLGLVYDLPF